MASTYRHFCLMARALEVVGDRWSLLIVRDLRYGPRRFTDLERSVAGISPKWLTLRLRELEAANIVERDREEGRREVWYTLTEKGRDLAPAMKALTIWGLKHARRPPLPGESVHPQHVMTGVTLALNDLGARPREPLSWLIRFVPDGTYTLTFDGEHWRSRPGEEPADLVVETTPEAWARFLMTTDRRPRIPSDDISLEGSPAKVAEFVSTFGGKR